MGTNSLQTWLDAVLNGLDRTGNGESLDIRDIYGHDKSDIELIALVEATEFHISNNANVKFVTSKGQFAIKRHHHNALRGDASSVEAHKISMKTVGMLQELGGEPFLIQGLDPSDNKTFLACHFASRCEGFDVAGKNDKEQKFKPVQVSIANGLRKCHIYSRKSPAWLSVFLVALGNSCDGHATITTIVEK